MSTAKTCLLPLSILILLLGLSACATQAPPSASRESASLEYPLEAMAEPLPSEPEQAAEPLPPLQEEGEELTIAEPEQTVSLEVQELEALGNWEEGTPEDVAEPETQYDFPVTINKQVDFYLDFFQNQQRTTFARWLARSGRFLPLIQKYLKEADLPLDLAYLPMIESGYNLTAYSRARAVGLWQFMLATARHYGLTVNEYVDERRDPEKATRAAVAYLSKLHGDFGSWPLAVAGYNAGEGKIRWARRKAGSDNFWQLSKHLHAETKRYVPKLMAAIIIAKNPVKYGFVDIDYEEPLVYETVEVPQWTALDAVAVASDTPLEELRDLNRELRKAITPPSRSRCTIKVPPGKKDLVAENLPRVRPILTTDYKTHIVQSRETLTRICRQYNLNKLTLLKANNLRSAELRRGQRLRIPYQTTTYRLLSEGELAGYAPGAVNRENLVLHTIKPGETLSTLGKKYNVPVHLIVTWNTIENVNKIRAGQQLAFYLEKQEPVPAPNPGRPPAPTVAKALRQLAPAAGKTKRQPVVDDKVAGGHLTYYQVRGGDTLWDIAKKFQLTPDKIKRWNNLKDDLIYPGLRLLLKVANDLGV